jgi:hypothetical protein
VWPCSCARGVVERSALQACFKQPSACFGCPQTGRMRGRGVGETLLDILHREGPQGLFRCSLLSFLLCLFPGSGSCPKHAKMQWPPCMHTHVTSNAAAWYLSPMS